MSTTTQQLPSNPALDFANAVLAETDGGREIVLMLHDIAQGVRENATTNDRINATNILMDRGLGKCPKQLRTPSTESERDPESAESDNHTNHSSDTPQTATPHSVPDSPRLVTQIDETLNQSLGPAPSAHTPTRNSSEQQTSDPLDPSSTHITIQQHILAITNNGRTLFDTLAEIARSKDGPKAKSCHRARAARILIDRILGTNTALPRSAPRTEPAQVKPYRRPVRYVDPVALAEARAKIQRMKDEGILTPDPTRPKIDISSYLPPDDFDLTPYAKEEAAAFLAEVNLRLERQKQWPEIEERRRKKLAQIYPSHSDDGPPNP